MRSLFLVGLLTVGGCTAEQNSTQYQALEGHKHGREIFINYCAACHGKSARGDGPLASELPVPPADLTMLSASNGGVFPQSKVMAKIHGYPGRYQAHVMPEFGPILTGPKVMWQDENGDMIETPQALLDLAEFLKDIQANPV